MNHTLLKHSVHIILWYLSPWTLCLLRLALSCKVAPSHCNLQSSCWLTFELFEQRSCKVYVRWSGQADQVEPATFADEESRATFHWLSLCTYTACKRKPSKYQWHTKSSSKFNESSLNVFYVDLAWKDRCLKLLERHIFCHHVYSSSKAFSRFESKLILHFIINCALILLPFLDLWSIAVELLFHELMQVYYKTCWFKSRSACGYIKTSWTFTQLAALKVIRVIWQVLR